MRGEAPHQKKAADLLRSEGADNRSRHEGLELVEEAELHERPAKVFYRCEGRRSSMRHGAGHAQHRSS